MESLFMNGVVACQSGGNPSKCLIPQDKTLIFALIGIYEKVQVATGAPLLG